MSKSKKVEETVLPIETTIGEDVSTSEQPSVKIKKSISQEDKDALKQEILADIGLQVLSNRNVTSSNDIVEEKKEIVAVNPSPVVEKPKKIIYEIKGIVDENHLYNGAFIPGKIVGKHPFNLVQQIVNKNTSFERDNDYYVTGLEPEFYLEDTRLTEEVINKRIEDSKAAKAYLEKKYNKSLSPTNYKFWSNVRFKINDIGLVYSTHKITNNANEDNLLMYYVILAGGCEDIAISYQEALTWGKNYYLTVREEESIRSFSDTKYKLTANSHLHDMLNNWKKEDLLFFIYSLNTKTNHGFTLDTPNEILIGELNDYIEGKNFKIDKKKKAQEFVELYKTYEAEPDLVKIKGLFNAADYFGFITVDRQTKEYKNRLTGFNYGSSTLTAYDKLMSPKNIEELSFIKKKVLDKWKM